MRKTATIVHLDALAGVTPLVGGYLKAYALADPEVRAVWDVELLSAPATTEASRLLRALVRRPPDVVAFSVYTWNARLVARLLPALRGTLPRTTRYLLGGVEVAGQARAHVRPEWEDVAVCDGEGERTFRALLLELSDERPDLARVPGLTCPRDGAWSSTPGPPRVQDLTELPSPWLGGIFDELPGREVALLETNRGCPFACEFCYWGGAIGQKVYRQDDERLRAELEVIARLGFRSLALCDANFGILPRDVELARHLAATARAHGRPSRVVFNSSKVHPERVEEISRVLAGAGLLTRHVFSIQSLDRTVLRRAKRTGIERATWVRIQRGLNEARLASVVELVWPLPGETLDSFERGVEALCRDGAQGFLVYPLLWLANTGYTEHTAEYGVTTLEDTLPGSAGRVVIATREVPFEDYLDGLRFAKALHLLLDCRGLPATLGLLDALGIAGYREVLRAFARWMDADAEGPIAERWRADLERFETMTAYAWRGEHGELVLHRERAAFDRLLAAFLAAHGEWTAGPGGTLVRSALELDLLARPYVLLQTPFELGVALETLELVERRPRIWRARAPFDLPRIAAGLRVGRAPAPEDLLPGSFALSVDHRGRQLFQLPRRDAGESRWLWTETMPEMVRFEPACTAAPLEEAARQLGG